MKEKTIWGYLLGILTVVGLGAWGCQPSAPPPKSSPSSERVSQPGVPSPSEMAGGQSPGGDVRPSERPSSSPPGEQTSKGPDSSQMSPKWWDSSATPAKVQASAGQTRSPESTESPGTEKPFSPSPELAPPKPGTSETLLPNPLRGEQPRTEPLRPEQIRLEMRPKASNASGPSAELPGGSDSPAPSGPVAPTPSGGAASSQRPPFDPYKEHGDFFVGWPNPKLALVLTGSRNGYIEPCGCAGKDRMKGGISRLHSMLLQLRENRKWPTVAFDVGGISQGVGLQGVLKFHVLADCMRKMGYDAVAFGAADLKFDLGDLIAVASEVDGKPGLFISSNVGLLGWDAGFTGKPRVVQAGGLKIGAIAVLGREFQKQIFSNDIQFEDPEKVARQQAEKLRSECDLLVLLAHASREESIELAKKVPQFDLVVTSGGAPEPPAQPQPIEGQKSWLIEVGEKGMYAVVVGIYDDPAQPRRYQRVVLDSRYPESEAMKQIMVAYQEQLKDLGLKGLGIQPVRHPRQEINGTFVGSKECESCHEPSYKVWKRSGHAQAWDTLVHLDPPRQYDPECITCHVVGWNPQKYFPYQGGFWGEKETPHLVGVGCENCHGPGGKHVEAELGRLGTDDAIKQKYRQAMILTLAEAEKAACLECHDLDNSPDFDFKTYWPKVEHREE